MKEQRKHHRYALRLPIELVRSGSRVVGETGETLNLSSSGVLFTTSTEVEVGQSIEFLITLPTGRDGVRVRLRGVGKVVRLEKDEPAQVKEAPSVAATLERFEFVRTAS